MQINYGAVLAVQILAMCVSLIYCTCIATVTIGNQLLWLTLYMMQEARGEGG